MVNLGIIFADYLGMINIITIHGNNHYMESYMEHVDGKLGNSMILPSGYLT